MLWNQTDVFETGIVQSGHMVRVCSGVIYLQKEEQSSFWCHPHLKPISHIGFFNTKYEQYLNP